jgi:hypothetical protein
LAKRISSLACVCPNWPVSPSVAKISSLALVLDTRPAARSPRFLHAFTIAGFLPIATLTCEELRYTLDPADVMGEDYPSETFRLLKNREIRDFGEYRTRRLVLEAWGRLERGER